MPIIVAHPGTQHSTHAARGLQRAGLLDCLFTSFSLQRSGCLASAIKTLAPSTHERLSQFRQHPGLSREELRVFPAYLLAERFGQSCRRVASRAFARAAGRLALRHGAGVLAFDTNATETFRILSGRGLPRILDQSATHRRWRERLDAEERERYPAWNRSRTWAVTAPEVVAEEVEELELADLVLCGSEFCASTLVAEGVKSEKVAVVPYGADTTRFAPGEECGEGGGEIRLLFVGALALRKGIFYLLEALKRVARLRVKLTLAGQLQVDEDALRPYADVIDTPGRLRHNHMPDLYRQHDVYVFPSLAEGSSLSIYEAMASGLPVIATSSSGSIVRDGVEGFVIRPRDVDGLVAAIEKLARHPELRLEMGRAARRRAVEFGDWTHYGERLANTILSRFPSVDRSPRASGGIGGPGQLGGAP